MWGVRKGRESALFQPSLVAAWLSSATHHGCDVSVGYLDGGDLLEELVHVSVLLFIDRRWWGWGAGFDVTAALRWPPRSIEPLGMRSAVG